MKFRPQRLFHAFLLISLTLNVALLTAWLIGPAGPLKQFEESESQWRRCAYQQNLELEERRLRKLSALRQQFQTAQHERCEEVAQHQRRLLELLKQTEVSEEEIRRTQQRIQKGQEQMLDLTVQRLVAEREVLDDEQRPQWFGYLESHVQCSDPMAPGTHNSGGDDER